MQLWPSNKLLNRKNETTAMRELIIIIVCWAISGCASLLGDVPLTNLKEAPIQEFILSNDYKKITVETVYGKIIEADALLCKGRYTSLYADSDGIYYLSPVECGGDYTGGIWVSNNPEYHYLHYWFIPKKSEIINENGRALIVTYKYQEAEGLLRKNPAKIISKEMYQEIISSRK